MDDRDAVAWLHRRAGFGLHPTVLAETVAAGAASALDDLTKPADLSIDPWAGRDLDPESDGRREAVVAWLQHMISSDQPFAERRTWMLHGWLVSSMAKVTVPELMVEQIRLLRARGGGSYPELLEAITVDRAMLVYLDGRTSTAEAPNENFARELLELFALGVGNYDEDDVQSAARSLTGWVIRRDASDAVFVPRRHDDTPQTLLGVDGVRTVDQVVDAIVAHPEHARFVARRIVREYLGDPAGDELPDAVDAVAAAYLEADRALDAAIRAALEIGLAGASRPMVLAPVAWLVISLRTTGASAARLGREGPARVREMGQLPLLPPDVSGWPYGDEWFTASSLIARTHVAAAIASATAASEPVRVALDDGDLDLTAEHLGLAGPFTSATAAAIRNESDPVDRLTLALVSPEHLLS